MAGIDRAALARAADWLMVAVAASLPWSTSATSILVVLWLIALIPTLIWRDVRRELLTLAGGLPVLLVLLGILGMLWADVSLVERWKGLDSFLKLLVIPLLFVQCRKSDYGHRAFKAFLAACVLLLIASAAVFFWPSVPHGSPDGGVFVKSYIVQSAEFTICTAVLLYLALERARDSQWRQTLGCLVLALCFMADMFFIATSRTSLVVLPALIVLFGARQFGWKGAVATIGAGVAVVAILWTASPYLRERVSGVWLESERFEAENVRTPSGERIMFWSRSIRFVESAPVIGHGTGSITEMFREAAIGQSGARGEVSSNPHNQTFAVAIQLGVLGAAILWVMWLSHLLLFRGDGLYQWIGLVVVMQNIVGSLFNSYLFDFTEGWLYVFGVGIAGGIVRRVVGASDDA